MGVIFLSMCMVVWCVLHHKNVSVRTPTTSFADCFLTSSVESSGTQLRLIYFQHYDLIPDPSFSGVVNSPVGIKGNR